MWRTVAVVVALLSLGCAGGGAAEAGAPPAEYGDRPLVTAVPTTTLVPPITALEPRELSVTTQPPPPVFSSAVHTVTADELGASWRPGCPVPVERLRRVVLAHWDDAGEVGTGALVVHEDHVDALVTVFGRLFDAGFPIHSMQPITDFRADDDASMAANNTSAFNCREISGQPGVWSQHAYGGAIDINPLVNPWVRGSRVDPPAGAPYVDRSAEVPGLIVAGDVVTSAFAEIGWGWGGDWSTTKDYQHFSHNGR